MALTSVFQGGSPSPSAKSLASSSKLPRRSPLPSQSSLPDPEDGFGARKTEAELEAERLWWSEASERQVKELESSFGSAFRKTAEKLSNDVASCKERLEMLIEAERKQRASLLSDLGADMAARMDRLEILVESEKSQRHTALLGLKRGLDEQEQSLQDFAQQQQQERQRSESRFEDKLHGVLRELSSEDQQAEVQDAHRLLSRLRSDFDAFQMQVTSKDATFTANWAYNKAQVSSLEGTVEDLQRRLGCEQKQEQVAAAFEASISNIQKDMTVIQETQKLCEAQNGSSSQEQVAALEAAVSDLRRCQEAQHARNSQNDSMFEDFRREVGGLRASVDARARTDEEVRSFHEVIMQSTCDLGKGLEEISATIVVAEEKLRKEVEELRSRLAAQDFAGALDASSRGLAKSIEEERASRTAELAALSAHLEVALERLERPQAPSPGVVTVEDLEKFRGVVQADVQTLRGHVEALGGELQSFGAGASRARSADVAAAEVKSEAEESFVSYCERLEDFEKGIDRRLSEALEQERLVRGAQIAHLQRVFGAAAGSPKGSPKQAGGGKPPRFEPATQQADAGLAKVVDEVRDEVRHLKMSMEVLEQRCPESVDYHSQAQELRAFGMRLEQADVEVKRATGSMGALGARVDACEKEVWRTSSETPAFATRLDVVESDMKRLRWESSASSADVGVLRSILGAMKAEEEEANRAEVAPPTPPPLPAAASPPPAESLALPPASAAVLRETSAMNTATTVGSSSGIVSEPELPSAPPPPMLSADLKASIGRLVQRVNTTLSSRPAGEKTPDPMARAALAVQELRERNVSLREENAGLVEELLADSVTTPSAAPPVIHISGGSYLPSAVPVLQANSARQPLGARPVRFSVDGQTAPTVVHEASGVVVREDGSAVMPIGGPLVVPNSSQVGAAPPRVRAAREVSPVRTARTVSPMRQVKGSVSLPSARHPGGVVVPVTQVPLPPQHERLEHV